MKKTLVLILIMTMITGLCACGTRRSVSEIDEEASISRDKSIYKEKNEDSEEKQAAKECWDYISGANGKELDYYKAAEALSGYEDSDDPDVMFCLGYMHMYPVGLKYDLPLALDLLKKAELGGNYFASIQLGIQYEEGAKDLDYDYIVARDYYRRAILNGLPEGYYGLARMYASGHGMEKDVDKALEYYNKVINEATSDYYIASANLDIGRLYYFGEKRDSTSEGDDPEYDKALEYFEKASSGRADAVEWLGYMYENGFGCDKDMDKAIEYYEKAANIGDTTSMKDLGWMYASGDGVDKDSEKALEWFNKAAELNDPNTLFALGQIYEGGISVDKDEAKAEEYYNKAYAAGYEE